APGLVVEARFGARLGDGDAPAAEDAGEDGGGFDADHAFLGGPAAADHPLFDGAAFAAGADGFEDDLPGAVDDAFARFGADGLAFALEEDVDAREGAGAPGEEAQVFGVEGARPVDPGDDA